MRARQQTVSAWSEKTLGPLFEQTKRQKERETERERARSLFFSLSHILKKSHPSRRFAVFYINKNDSLDREKVKKNERE
jgi:hypothetical protein